jgi:hypothetical protein
MGIVIVLPIWLLSLIVVLLLFFTVLKTILFFQTVRLQKKALEVQEKTMDVFEEEE